MMMMMKDVHVFFKVINWRVNVMVRFEFKRVYFLAAVQYVSHFSLGTLLRC